MARESDRLCNHAHNQVRMPATVRNAPVEIVVDLEGAGRQDCR